MAQSNERWASCPAKSQCCLNKFIVGIDFAHYAHFMGAARQSPVSHEKHLVLFTGNAIGQKHLVREEKYGAHKKSVNLTVTFSLPSSRLMSWSQIILSFAIKSNCRAIFMN